MPVKHDIWGVTQGVDIVVGAGATGSNQKNGLKGMGLISRWSSVRLLETWAIKSLTTDERVARVRITMRFKYWNGRDYKFLKRLL